LLVRGYVVGRLGVSKLQGELLSIGDDRRKVERYFKDEVDAAVVVLKGDAGARPTALLGIVIPPNSKVDYLVCWIAHRLI